MTLDGNCELSGIAAMNVCCCCVREYVLCSDRLSSQPIGSLASFATSLTSTTTRAMKSTRGVHSQKRKVSDRTDTPPFSHGDLSKRQPTLLEAAATLEEDEEYTENEIALNEFLKLHPMLSMSPNSQETLKLLVDTYSSTAMPIVDLPVVPKSHDDMYLRPADTSIGERGCICGDMCICNKMAHFRYGEGTDLAFIGVEFLLPEERNTFIHQGKLPQRRKKCLLCTRYYINYIYILARTDPEFTFTTSPVALQTFSNAIGHVVASVSASEAAESLRCTSPVRSSDGYRPSAMLFVDDAFLTSSPHARSGVLSTLVWKPVLRFCSTHYRYIKGNEGGPRIVQIGVGSLETTVPRFQRPPVGGVNPLAASSLTWNPDGTCEALQSLDPPGQTGIPQV